MTTDLTAARLTPSMTRAPHDFAAVYAEHFGFVWRNLRRLGVAEESLRDAAQEVFMVVHRRLVAFEEGGSLKSWLYSIVKRVASGTRRTQRRRGMPLIGDADHVSTNQDDPEALAVRAEALERLIGLLATLDEDKRDVFVLADLEEMSAPEIALAVGCNLNTVYSRLRVARERLRAAYEKQQSLEGVKA